MNGLPPEPRSLRTRVRDRFGEPEGISTTADRHIADGRVTENEGGLYSGQFLQRPRGVTGFPDWSGSVPALVGLMASLIGVIIIVLARKRQLSSR